MGAYYVFPHDNTVTFITFRKSIVFVLLFFT